MTDPDPITALIIATARDEARDPERDSAIEEAAAELSAEERAAAASMLDRAASILRRHGDELDSREI
jgi:hypothetical protein